MSWSQFAFEAPELAARLHAVFDAHKHKVLGTIRADGSPRLSGLEALIAGGELWLGMMPDSYKANDLRRDPRFALHSAPLDLELGDGDAKVAGRAVEVTDPARIAEFWRYQGRDAPPIPAAIFTADLTEASLATVRGDEMVIDSWKPGQPQKQTRRK